MGTKKQLIKLTASEAEFVGAALDLGRAEALRQFEVAADAAGLRGEARNQALYKTKRDMLAVRLKIEQLYPEED